MAAYYKMFLYYTLSICNLLTNLMRVVAFYQIDMSAYELSLEMSCRYALTSHRQGSCFSFICMFDGSVNLFLSYISFLQFYAKKHNHVHGPCMKIL